MTAYGKYYANSRSLHHGQYLSGGLGEELVNMTLLKECPGHFEAKVDEGFEIKSGGQVEANDPRAQYDSLTATVRGQPQCLAKRLGLVGGAGVCGFCCHIVAIGKPKIT